MEVKTIISDWAPPFAKKITTNDFAVELNKGFDTAEKVKGEIFHLVEFGGNKVLVQFCPEFTLKGHEHPGDRRVWVDMKTPVSFTYLWGEKGITKKIILKAVKKETITEVPQEIAKEPECVETIQEDI